MKRYTVTGYLDRKVIAYLFDGERELVDATDLQSHARTLLAVAERMEHSELCPANYCIKPAITGDECCQIERAHRRIPDHAFQGGECNCALGELRRGLEVMIK